MELTEDCRRVSRGEPDQGRKIRTIAAVFLLVALAFLVAVCAGSAGDIGGSVLSLSNDNRSTGAPAAVTADRGPPVGDCNRDGTLTSGDALMALQMSTGNLPKDMNADINNDGRVSSFDAVLILRASTGIAPSGNGSPGSDGGNSRANTTGQVNRSVGGPGSSAADPKRLVAGPGRTDGGTGTGEDAETTLLDMIVSIPRTIISIVSLSPATTQETRAGQQDAEISIADISSDDRGDDAVTLIDLSTGNEQPGDLNTVIVSEEPGKYFSGNFVTVRDLDSEQEYRNNTGDAAVPENTGGTILQVGITTTAAIELQPRTGRIACPEGRVSCTGACINVTADASNCGACGNACRDKYTCYLGTCRPG